MPKRSLESDFDMTQSVPNPKGKTARRGPVGASKAQKKTAFAATGAVAPRTAEGQSERARQELIFAFSMACCPHTHVT